MPSSVVVDMEYDPGTSTLRVVFVSGAIYEYKKVPPAVYRQMKTAASKGTYLNQRIKPAYSFKKIR